MLTFNSIPLDIRTPGQFIEFDSSRAMRGLAPTRRRVLICGQKLAAGSAAAATPVRVRNEGEAVTLAGRGSMLHRMVKFFKLNDPTSETWMLPLADNGAGTAAVGSAVVGGPSTGAGTIPLYIAGQYVPVGVASGQSATVIGAAIAAAVGAAPDLPVTAAAVTGTVTLTAKHKGLGGNDIDVRTAYQIGDLMPAGVTLAITAMGAGTPGAGNPDGSAVFTAIGDDFFSDFVWPWTDATNLSNLETVLATRWGPMKALDGQGWWYANGSLSTLDTLGATRNSPYVSPWGLNKSPTPPWEAAAIWAATNGLALSIDPARPTQTLQLLGMLAPAVPDRFIRDDRDTMLRSGMSTATIDSGGNVLVDRAVTSFQTDAYALPSTAYLDVNTPAILSYLRYTQRVRIASKFPRHKLVDDGTPISPGAPIVSPKIIRNELIALASDWVGAGLVENLDQFKTDMVVERASDDPNRVNVLIAPDLVNGFRVLAGQIQYLL